jgi:hypothetical protein
MMISYLRTFLLLLGSPGWLVPAVTASNEEGGPFRRQQSERRRNIATVGMQYKVLEQGTGVFHPQASTVVSIITVV